ncbi:glucose-6-phosphate isomerase family protein [Herbiconiux sp. KACC 21604]|uniref:glucose-6-phosphate isomerase family protein n=1 Tax=unclassified Herbiconiux TaxID=2618217 RepID=UPI001491A769|nr:glucose-6-phosphate isomerase family protein [Herbiconiux sp. SALV-R1]QJU55735.1 glucose-6-phosphate isomerase [Herbiconiux sp. SALV-R1]WPO86943.1 glucose-6-phosphate isomerase family protein [Herbiconiux sp. KACC 21604]
MCDAAHPAEPAALDVDALRARLTGPAERYEKHLTDLAGLYRDADAFAEALDAHDGSPVYWVDSSIVEQGDGALTIGLSVLRPGRVGEEYAMTRGHLHARSEHAEMYYGIAGSGVMLLDSLTGESRAVPIGPGTVVHVPGGWVHRSVNVGDEVLQTLFCYATDAGQDYGIIERAGGMSTLVVASDEGWTTRDNPDHGGYGA